MKVKIGDKVICKLDNKEYTIISTTTSSDGVGKSSFRIKMENKNKNTIEVDEVIFDEMFEDDNWCDWICNSIYLGDNSYRVSYRYNNRMFEMKRANDKGETVTAKTHPDDKFDFYKGFEIVELRMKKQILKEQLKSIEELLKRY